MRNSSVKPSMVKGWGRRFIEAFRLSREDKEITRTVIGMENIRRVFYLSLIAIPTSACYFIIFMLKAESETGVLYQWRQAIWICHAVIFVSFSIISVLIYFYAFKPAKNSSLALVCVHITAMILLLEGAALAAADQLVTSNITPYLITCLITALVLLTPPVFSVLYYIFSFAVFYFAISLTQKNTAVLISNQINGLTIAALGICLSIILWRGYLIRVKQSKVIEKQNSELKAAFDKVNSQKEDVEQLSRIGRDITSSLSIENIIQTIYDNVNSLMDAPVFTIGLYHSEKGTLEFPSIIESNRLLPPFSVALSEQNHLAVRCFHQHQEVVINDCEAGCGQFTGLLSNSLSRKSPLSLLYLPLWNKDKIVGVISAQSYNKNAYSDYHVNVLRNLAAFSAIALENADAYRRLAALLEELKATQDKLVTQSKLAALGALTAGIAHEIKNPLNFINNFAELSTELVEELASELARARPSHGPQSAADLDDLLNTLRHNAEKIREHGKRADNIVRSMLQHSRGKSGERQAVDLNALLAEDVNLTYHGMRAQDSSFNIKIETRLDPEAGSLEVVPQDISRVFLNILANACYETNRKKSTMDSQFVPLLKVSSRRVKDGVEVRIRDNGSGVPEEIRDKLFLPFFTTKPTGQGTGLGLSISYDIVVHEHKGMLSFETAVGEYTEFVIFLPDAQ
ncbi:MAG TPA: GAF domain-containing sensor histidine kinase [bacterium]|nr:GAF domain-containing sensor histidine kinase [bacterium]HPN33580.1 GAF domain-containing sensor histidine kinase [bacterium]